VAQAASGAAPTIDDRLRVPALADDWAAWASAWQTFDAGPLADLRAAPAGPASLTLCGERSWARFEPAPRGLLQRMRSVWSPTTPQALLEML
jgi:hypothetical protein